MATVEEKIKVKVMRRVLENVAFVIRKEKDTRSFTFSASSDKPVDRWYGTEILSHEPGAVRFDRVRRGAVPLLFNHRTDDPIGMVDDARLVDSRLIIDAHLFDISRANDVAKMIEGGFRNVSIAYQSHVIVENVKEETFTVTDWELLEVSPVSIPADPSVGIGRSSEEEVDARILRASEPAFVAEGGEMAEKEITAAAADNAEKQEPNQKVEQRSAEPRIEVGTSVGRPNPVDLEKARKRAIENLCKANQLDDKYRDHWIGAGIALEDVSDDILKILEERGKSNPQPASKLGLSSRDTQKFSLLRAIRAIVEKNWTNAPFELECSRSVAQKLGRVVEPEKFYVPFDVMERPIEVPQRRDLTQGTPGAGGYLVSTANLGFIEMVRNRSVAFRMGARRLSGLVGSVTVPRQSAAATAYWLGTEATQITESQQTFVQMALTPHNVGAYTEISRQLMLQSSPGAEGIVTDDLAQVVAIAADLAVLSGSGTAGQPQGITGTSGIGTVSGTALAYAGLLEFQTDVATANVTPVAGGYVTTPAVAGLMMARVMFASTASPNWVGNIWEGSMVGWPCMSSAQMVAATMLFGDWQEVVVAEWGVLEVDVNPYANFQAGIIGIRAIYSLDVGVRRPFAFSYAHTIT